MHEVKILKTAEAIDAVLEHEGISQRQMALKMGTTPQNINQKLRRREDVRVNTLISMLDALGYDLIAKKRNEEH